MNFLITGASGLIGQALTDHLIASGHRVIPLARNEPSAAFYWQPERNFIRLDDSTKLDVVINLAGPGVADKRWSPKRKRELLESRVNATRLLSEAQHPRRSRRFG